MTPSLSPALIFAAWSVRKRLSSASASVTDRTPTAHAPARQGDVHMTMRICIRKRCFWAACQVKDHTRHRAGEHEGHTRPRAGEHEGHQGPRAGGFSPSLAPPTVVVSVICGFCVHESGKLGQPPAVLDALDHAPSTEESA